MNYGNKSAFSLRYHYSKYARIKRISQGTDSTEEDFHDIYEEASAIATGVLGSMQTLARTANCKGVQIHNLVERIRKMYFGLEKEKDMMQVGDMKFIDFEETLDRDLGPVGTPRRDEFERNVDESVHAYKLGEAIRQARLF